MTKKLQTPLRKKLRDDKIKIDYVWNIFNKKLVWNKIIYKNTKNVNTNEYSTICDFLKKNLFLNKKSNVENLTIIEYRLFSKWEKK